MRAVLFYIALIFLTGSLFTGRALNSYAAGSVIAAIMSSDQPRYREAHRSFIKSLAARGYTPTTTEIILQVPNPDPLSWSNTIRKFNAYKPSLILAYGAPAALIAMKESDGIPVVSADIYNTEPPAKGMCGVSSRVPMITLLKTLQEIKPYRRIGILYTSREAGSQRQADDIKKNAIQLGTGVVEGNFTTAAAFEAGINAFIERVDVLIVTESSISCRNFDRIISRAKVHNKPVASIMPDSAEKGALVSLEISPQEQGHLAAEITVRILEGATPEHLLLLMPRRVELVVNMRTARELGINLPFAVLSNATRVLK
jgi:putative ABC transport system substrate-binding protein